MSEDLYNLTKRIEQLEKIVKASNLVIGASMVKYSQRGIIILTNGISLTYPHHQLFGSLSIYEGDFIKYEGILEGDSISAVSLRISRSSSNKNKILFWCFLVFGASHYFSSDSGWIPSLFQRVDVTFIRSLLVLTLPYYISIFMVPEIYKPDLVQILTSGSEEIYKLDLVRILTSGSDIQKKTLVRILISVGFNYLLKELYYIFFEHQRFEFQYQFI